MCFVLFFTWWTIQNGFILLWIAAQNGHLDVIKYLVTECKADAHLPQKANGAWDLGVCHIHAWGLVIVHMCYVCAKAACNP